MPASFLNSFVFMFLHHVHKIRKDHNFIQVKIYNFDPIIIIRHFVNRDVPSEKSLVWSRTSSEVLYHLQQLKILKRSRSEREPVKQTMYAISDHVHISQINYYLPFFISMKKKITDIKVKINMKSKWNRKMNTQ